MCGEDGGRTRYLPRTLETPPRVWGRLLRRLRHGQRSRNTPTCVGKTIFQCQHQADIRKHPHVCGEDWLKMPTVSSGLETPPRVWGRPECGHNIVGYCRNTPTCVGKTSNGLRPLYEVKKHPHVCGEDTAPQAHHLRRKETPPRVWGRLHLPYAVFGW